MQANATKYFAFLFFQKHLKCFTSTTDYLNQGFQSCKHHIDIIRLIFKFSLYLLILTKLSINYKKIIIKSKFFNSLIQKCIIFRLFHSFILFSA